MFNALYDKPSRPVPVVLNLLLTCAALADCAGAIVRDRHLAVKAAGGLGGIVLILYAAVLFRHHALHERKLFALASITIASLLWIRLLAM